MVGTSNLGPEMAIERIPSGYLTYGKTLINGGL